MIPMKKRIQKLGVLGDIHCQTKALRNAIALLKEHNADCIVAVGDIVDGPGDVNETCAILDKENILAVAGNHERWLLSGEMRALLDATPVHMLSEKSRRYLNALPKTLSIETPMGKALICHGVDTDDMSVLKADTGAYDIQFNAALQNLFRERRYSLMIGGHTHERMVRYIDGICFINAGTLHPRYNPCVLLADFEARQATFFDCLSDKTFDDGASGRVSLARP